MLGGLQIRRHWFGDELLEVSRFGRSSSRAICDAVFRKIQLSGRLVFFQDDVWGAGGRRYYSLVTSSASSTCSARVLWRELGVLEVLLLFVLLVGDLTLTSWR
jgi:hypothetical protein